MKAWIETVVSQVRQYEEGLLSEYELLTNLNEHIAVQLNVSMRILTDNLFQHVGYDVNNIEPVPLELIMEKIAQLAEKRKCRK